MEQGAGEAKGATDLFAGRGGSVVNGSLLDMGNPVGEGGVKDGVDDDGEGSIMLGGLETVLVIPQEASGGEDKGCVA